jgi:hypothetical protein
MPPRLVAIDTSSLADLARDKYSTSATSQESVREFERAVDQGNWCPLISYNHLEELLAHGNDLVVENSIKFLEDLPKVAWINEALRNDNSIGYVADILAIELSALLSLKTVGLSCDRSAVTKQAKNQLIHHGTGKELVSGWKHAWKSLRPEILELKKKKHNTVAIDHIDLGDDPTIKVMDILRCKFASPSEARDGQRRTFALLESQLEARGDIDVNNNKTKQAIEFVVGSRENYAALDQNDYPEKLRIMYVNEITMEDITEDTTDREAKELVEFRKKLRIASKKVKAPWSFSKAFASPDLLPCWIIQNAVRKFGQEIPRHSGSEINDRYLLCLSPYAEITYVDKRTLENVKRATQQDPPFKSVINEVRKAAHYNEITERLKN